MKHSQQRMFQNPILELLSKSGPVMMTIFHLLIISFLVYQAIHLKIYSSLFLALGIFILAFLFWTFAEYLLHRYLFHYVNENSQAAKAFHYALHGYHHEEPNDSHRLFMPPLPASLFLLTFFGVFYLLMQQHSWLFLAGFELGYLVYANMHYRVHTQQAPPFLQALWKHHALHHYKYPDKAFGVSSRLWDRIFNTMPPEEHHGGAEAHA